MSRRADHSVIKSKSQTLFIRNVGVYYIGRKRVALSESCKKHLGVSLQVTAATDRQQKSVFKQLRLIIVAKDRAIASLLFGFKKFDHVGIVSVEKHQLRRGGIMLILHSG